MPFDTFNLSADMVYERSFVSRYVWLFERTRWVASCGLSWRQVYLSERCFQGCCRAQGLSAVAIAAPWIQIDAPCQSWATSYLACPNPQCTFLRISLLSFEIGVRRCLNVTSNKNASNRRSSLFSNKNAIICLDEIFREDHFSRAQSTSNGCTTRFVCHGALWRCWEVRMDGIVTRWHC